MPKIELRNKIDIESHAEVEIQVGGKLVVVLKLQGVPRKGDTIAFKDDEYKVLGVKWMAIKGVILDCKHL